MFRFLFSRLRLIVPFSILIAGLFLTSVADCEVKYYGAKNQEATFNFETQILIPTARGEITDKLIKSEFKIYARFILGQMRQNDFSPAALYPNYAVKVKKVEKFDNSLSRVFLEFSGKGIFKPKQEDYTFYIPIYSANIFKKSNGSCSNEVNGVEESNFWYHWNPEKYGCPLVKEVDYLAVMAQLKYIPDTIKTYPEYEKLFRDGVKNGLEMTILFGTEKHDSINWNPDSNNDDWGAVGYQQEKKFLIRELGFQSYIWPEEKIRMIYNPPAGKPIPRVETLTKDTAHGIMTIRLFFGATDLYRDSKAFHLFYKNALENDSVVIYNGHSGIGNNLDIAKIENLRGFKIKVAAQYQIYFFGSCVPYSYFTDMYFKRKMTANDKFGTKNLDIITYGNESTFANTDDIRLVTAVLSYMESNTRTSYQDIIDKNSESYLGVNGDEAFMLEE